MLDVGLANELKLAFRRAGYTSEDIKRLCEGDILADVRRVFFGSGTTVLERKGRQALRAFLDTELPKLGLAHWYFGDDYSIGNHFIGEPGKRSLVDRMFGPRHRIVAEIIAEPDSPLEKPVSDAFRVRVFDPEVLAAIQQLMHRFANAGFGVPAEVIQ